LKPRAAPARLLAAIGVLACAAAGAQTYPARPIRLVVAQAAGGASDLLIRPLAQKLNEALGQQVIVDNRPGAGGNIGAETAAKAPADGYTLFMISAPHAIAPSLYRKLGYDLMRDFTPVGMIGSEPLALVVHPSIPAKTVQEFVAFAKRRPGQSSYASTGNGAVNHLAMELLKSLAKIDIVHVPYKGTPAALPDVIGGTVPILIANVGPLLPHIGSGKLRPLGVTSRKRVASLRDVPTIAASGYPSYEAVNWYGILAPAQSPADIVAKLNAAMRQAMAAADTRDYYETRGIEPMAGSPADMRAFVQSEIRKWAEVVRASGAKLD
jgi:tripartite-type tricarboxylate transporter receptor subunit TctC